MQIERRSVLRLVAAALACSGSSVVHKRVLAAASPLALRLVARADAPALQAIMNACVTGTTAFHGACQPWSLDWAAALIKLRPATIVLTRAGLPVAFHELPTIRPAPEPLPAGATDGERKRFALRVETRTTFRLTAAGVRADLLSHNEAVEMFRRTLYYGARAALRQGFVYGEARVPWEHHPKMPRRWTDYPGCSLVEAPSRSAVSGRAVYWLRWRLDRMAGALAAEGAGAEALDVS